MTKNFYLIKAVLLELKMLVLYFKNVENYFFTLVGFWYHNLYHRRIISSLIGFIRIIFRSHIFFPQMYAPHIKKYVVTHNDFYRDPRMPMVHQILSNLEYILQNYKIVAHDYFSIRIR